MLLGFEIINKSLGRILCIVRKKLLQIYLKRFSKQAIDDPRYNIQTMFYIGYIDRVGRIYCKDI